MNTFWNVLWVFPFCGWIVAILYGLLGLCVCATVVGLPIGLGLLQYSLFLFWPHGNAMISKSDLEIITEKSRPTWWKVFALIVQIIYFPFGLINAIFGVTYGFLCLVTIIGIPEGLVVMKSISTLFNPVNKVKVPSAVANEIARIKAMRRYSSMEANVNQVAIPNTQSTAHTPQSTKENSITPITPSVSDPRAAIPVLEKNEEEEKQKKLFLIGGIVSGIIVVGIILFFIFRTPTVDSDMTNRSSVLAESLLFRSTPSSQNNENVISSLPYGSPLTVISMIGNWAEVEFEGKKGYVSARYILPDSTFQRLERAWENKMVRNVIDQNRYRYAIATYLETNSMETGPGKWIVPFLNPKNVGDVNTIMEVNLKNGLDKFPEFAFTLQNEATNEKRIVIYSFDPNDETPTLIYEEEANPSTAIKNITLDRKGNVKIKYENVFPEKYETDYEEIKSYEESRTDIDNSMRGSMDNKYDIIMDFVEYADGSVKGTYKYVKYNTPISIVGSYTVVDDGSHIISLEERVNGNVVGNFVGRYDGRVYSGSWISVDGEKELPFKVEK